MIFNCFSRNVCRLAMMFSFLLGATGNIYGNESADTKANELVESESEVHDKEWAELYETESGHSLREGQAALNIFGGYPTSGFSFLIAPINYMTFGALIEIGYSPCFIISGVSKFQMLESHDRRFNMALGFLPGFEFDFDENAPIAAWFNMKPGLYTGVRMVKGWTLFLQMEYLFKFPFGREKENIYSPIRDGIAPLAVVDYRYKPYFVDHHPILSPGLEVEVTQFLNLYLSALIAFEHYDPKDFTYGGKLGLSLPLWK